MLLFSLIVREQQSLKKLKRRGATRARLQEINHHRKPGSIRVQYVELLLTETFGRL